jgi:hypothetical protein
MKTTAKKVVKAVLVPLQGSGFLTFVDAVSMPHSISSYVTPQDIMSHMSGRMDIIIEFFPIYHGNRKGNLKLKILGVRRIEGSREIEIFGWLQSFNNYSGLRDIMAHQIGLKDPSVEPHYFRAILHPEKGGLLWFIWKKNDSFDDIALWTPEEEQDRVVNLVKGPSKSDIMMTISDGAMLSFGLQWGIHIARNNVIEEGIRITSLIAFNDTCIFRGDSHLHRQCEVGGKYDVKKRTGELFHLESPHFNET